MRGAASRLEDDRRLLKSGSNGHATGALETLIEKIPASDLDSEKSVLGCMFADSKTVPEVLELLKTADFYDARCRIVFDTIKDNWAQGKPADLVLTGLRLQEKGLLEEAGGDTFLHDIIESVPHAIHVRYYAEEVVKLARRRDFGVRAAALALQSRMPTVPIEELRLDASKLLEATEPLSQEDNPFSFLDADELANADFDQKFYVADVLAVGRPAGIYGSFKTLKTSIAIDLGISIASGLPFLDRFEVLESVPVAIMSHESGNAALQDVFNRVCAAKHLSARDLKGGYFTTSMLPKPGELGDMRKLRKWGLERRIKVIILDPAYLMLDVEDKAGNMFAMGKALKVLAESISEWDCTPLLLHHNKRAAEFGAERFRPAELSDIAWSGFAEFAAQWILVSRRKAFSAETGDSTLWLNIGGRAGHGGLYGMNVHEGLRSDPGGRVWQVTTRFASEVRSASATDQSKAQIEKSDRKKLLTLAGNVIKVANAMKDLGKAESKSEIAHLALMNNGNATPALHYLLSNGIVRNEWITKGRQKTEGWVIADPVRADKVGQSRTDELVRAWEGRSDNSAFIKALVVPHPSSGDGNLGGPTNSNCCPASEPLDWEDF